MVSVLFVLLINLEELSFELPNAISSKMCDVTSRNCQIWLSCSSFVKIKIFTKEKTMIQKTNLIFIIPFLFLFSCCLDSEKDLLKDFVFVKGATIEGAIQAEGYPQSDCFKAGAKYEIKDFYISNHELTQSEFAKYYPGYEYRINENEYSIGPDYPAYDLSWFDALIYCNYRSMAEGRTPCYTINDSTNPKDWGKVPKDVSWGNLDVWLKAKCDFNANGYRLPKYVEWEYAARGGNGLTGYQYKYAGSDNIDEVAVWKVKELAKIKTKKANDLGLYDMTGNVEEWCWDRVGNDLNRACPSCNYYLVEEWSFELAKAIRSNMRDVTSRGTQIGLRLVCTAD